MNYYNGVLSELQQNVYACERLYCTFCLLFHFCNHKLEKCRDTLAGHLKSDGGPRVGQHCLTAPKRKREASCRGLEVMHCIVLYCIVLYCIVLYCIVLYCIVLYCIVSI